MSLPGILGGFESLQKYFFQIFGVKEKVEKNRYNPNFGGNILSISTDNRNFGNFVPWE